jgi:hypothetical protein
MNKRWMAEIYYRTDREMAVYNFEELEELHDIVEFGPDWNEIDHIIVTLNRGTFVLKEQSVEEAT